MNTLPASTRRPAPKLRALALVAALASGLPLARSAGPVAPAYQATGIEEWSVGAASDAHAGGWNEDQPRPEHLFLRTKHGGFLSGEVKAADARSTLTLRLHDTGGAVVFEATKPAAR